MSTNTNTDLALREQLTAAEREVSDLRGKRATLLREHETSKAAVVKGPTSDMRPGARTYDKALRVVDDLRRAEDDLGNAVEKQAGILKLLGEEAPSRPSDPSMIDTKQAGGWLSKTLRLKALGTADIGSTTDTAVPFFDRLREMSAVMAAGVNVLDISTSAVKIPTLTGRLPIAVPVPELAPLPSGNPPFDNRLITPPKFGSLVELSLEAYRDARPEHLAAVERELISAIADGFDESVFNGAAIGPHPGILNTTGTLAISAGATLANLDSFADAIAALASNNANAGAMFMHPSVWARLVRLKERTDSNLPLVTAEMSPTGTPVASILGVPVYTSVRMPVLKVIVADRQQMLVIRRSNVETAVDESYQFATAGVGVRVIMRAQHVLQQATGVAVITLP